MKGIVTSYRRSRHTQYPEQVLISAKEVDSFAKAHTLLGKKVIIKNSPISKMQGKVIAVHGKKGIVRARFTKGVPGQAIGKECDIL